MIPYTHDTHPCTRRKNNKTLIVHEIHSTSNHFSSSRHTWVVNSTYACMTYACKASTQALPSKIPQFFLEKPYFRPPAAPAKKFTYETHPSFNLLHYTDFVRWITDPQATGSTQWHAGPTCTKDNCNGLFKCSSRVIREPPPNAQEVRPRPWQEIWKNKRGKCSEKKTYLKQALNKWNLLSERKYFVQEPSKNFQISQF